jgi:hypothetical protein
LIDIKYLITADKEDELELFNKTRVALTQYFGSLSSPTSVSKNSNQPKSSQRQQVYSQFDVKDLPNADLIKLLHHRDNILQVSKREYYIEFS